MIILHIGRMPEQQLWLVRRKVFEDAVRERALGRFEEVGPGFALGTEFLTDVFAELLDDLVEVVDEVRARAHAHARAQGVSCVYVAGLFCLHCTALHCTRSKTAAHAPMRIYIRAMRMRGCRCCSATRLTP